MTPARIERVVTQTDRAIRRLEQERIMALRRYLEESHRRLRERIRVGWPAALEGVSGTSRVLREARARAQLVQLQAALDALRVGDPSTGVPALVRDMVVLGQTESLKQQRAIIEEVARAARARNAGTAALETIEALTRFSAGVNVAAVEAQVANASARLVRYADATIDRINQAVVDGLVRGSGWRPVAREVRAAVLGDPNAAGTRGGLAFQAETIARTELVSSMQDARDRYYEEQGIDLVIWYATEDERTCAFCGARSGNVYKRDDVIIPAHPRCRCVASAFRPEWAELGIVDMDDLAKHRADVLEQYRAAHGDTARFSTAASPFEKAAGRTSPPTPADI